MKNKTLVSLLIILILLLSLALAQEDKGEKVLETVSFDPRTATVSYELTHPAKVRIRIGTKDGPLFRTIVDWEERGMGSYKEEWDGMDASGKIKLVGNHDLVFTFNYFTEDDAFLKNVGVEDIMPHPEQLIVGRFLPSLDINRIHKKHNPAHCYDPQLIIKLPRGVKFTNEGRAIIKDKIQIMAELAKKDKQWMNRERYSIHVFVDGIFFSGELEGYSPYNFIFDPANINQGEHVLTVNYSGFDDHIAMASIPLFVKKGSEKIAQAK